MRTLRKGMSGEGVRYLQYSAEGNPKPLDIQGLIAARQGVNPADVPRCGGIKYDSTTKQVLRSR